VNKYRSIHSVTGRGGGGEERRGDWVMLRTYTGLGVIHCIFDLIPNLQNGFTTPNKNLRGRGPQIDKQLPPSTFTGQFLRKADI
jgi:hypothetical protein